MSISEISHAVRPGHAPNATGWDPVTFTASTPARLWSVLMCPACGGHLLARDTYWCCRQCERTFPIIAGLPDLRLRSDRYLTLDAERARAEELAQWRKENAPDTVLDVAARYYEITGDPRRDVFLPHIADAVHRAAPLAAQLPTDPNALVIELGCGTGGLLIAAALRGVPIIGMDIASRWLVVAEQRLRDHQKTCRDIPLIAADAHDLPLADASVDAVVADSLVEHLDNPVTFFRECARVLKPGGQLFLWSPNRHTLMRDPHVHLCGVGFLPRRLARVYVRLRRGKMWPPNTETASGVTSQHFRDPRIWSSVDSGPAPIPLPKRLEASPFWRMCRSLYDKACRHRYASKVLKRFGPVWRLSAVRADDPNRNPPNPTYRPGKHAKRLKPHPAGEKPRRPPHYVRDNATESSAQDDPITPVTPFSGESSLP